MVVEKTRVFHCCEPGGGEGQGEKKEKQFGYVDPRDYSGSQGSQGSRRQTLDRKAKRRALGAGEADGAGRRRDFT